jgi:hypothetical protein
MSLAQVRRRCLTLLDEIDVPDPFDLTVFRDRIARRRGRPVHLHPLPADADAGTPCGVCLTTDDADHIFHVPGTSPLHQQHIILHELGHLLCDHVGAGEASTEAVSRLLPDLSPGMVRRVLWRSSYSSVQEQMAEMMASLVLGRAGPPRRYGSAVLDRIHDALGEPMRGYGG